MALTAKKQLFVEKYFACDMNGAQAAIEAGYSERSARQIGSKLLKDPAVAAAIRERLAAQVMGADEALRAMSDIARSSAADFITVKEGGWRLDLDKAAKAGKLHLIKKIRERKDGTLEVELYDKQAAIGTIGKHHGLWKDGVEIKIDVTLVVSVIEAIEAAGLRASDVFNGIIASLVDSGTGGAAGN